MARIRTANEIILSLLDYFRVSQPNLDTKPGSVARDLFVDGSSTQMGRLYEELARISSLQSLRLSIGSDLDKLGANFGATRRRGSKSSGPALLTFTNIAGDIAISAGDIVTAKNGATFIVTNGIIVSATYVNAYRAIASQYRADLDFVGITDQYAITVQTEATASGLQGNISKYTLSSTSISGVSNITNAVAFGGGQLPEDDTTFRSRVLAVFSGANTGTALGYRNAVLEDPASIDSVVVEPGDTLMTRDGTQVYTAPNGDKTIVSPGTGGKVDIYVYGSRLQQVIDSFIYIDKSNTGDPTNSKNDFVLGQIIGEESLTFAQRRLKDLAAATLPQQPINNIIDVSGTLSGANFVQKNTDSLGRITGNYELLKDTGEYAGSPWGFDRLHWISNKISAFQEEKTKGTFNGQDSLSFTDISIITAIEQRISVTNENSKANSLDRSILQLSHYPITDVTKVFNVTSGERYVIVSQNVDGGTINTTGRIKISGGSLPAKSDTLQVDYTWLFKYDPYFDYDNLSNSDNERPAIDSVDWGYSNLVKREPATLIATGSTLTVTTVHAISTVISVNKVSTHSTSVTLTSGRLSVVLPVLVTGIISVIRTADDAELWNTSKNDGTFSNMVAFLPSDTLAEFGNAVIVTYNAIDLYNATNAQGSFNADKITIVPSSQAVAGDIVEANYIANVSIILPITLLPELPAVRSSNSFDTNTQNGIGTQPNTFTFSGLNIIDQNLRQAPTRAGLTISGAISPGIINVSGTTMVGVFNIVYTVGTSGLKQNLTSAIRRSMGLNSSGIIPANLKIARLDTVEKVETSSNLDVLSVTHVYDIRGYQLNNNIFVRNESIINPELLVTEVQLPATSDNENNAPAVGDRIRISFHYSLTNDTESVSFSQSGTLYTNKIFALIDSIGISSGFTSGSSASSTLTVFNQNQPSIASRYKTIYDYTAPKSNERIAIRYNQNGLITASTLSVETVRPINADVLIKDSTRIGVDVQLYIVVTNAFINNTATVIQNVRDVITSALNANSLGTVIDQSDLIDVAYTIDGVDRIRITYFNKQDVGKGSVLSIQAQKNEYLSANEVLVNVETR